VSSQLSIDEDNAMFLSQVSLDSQLLIVFNWLQKEEEVIR